jgi:hypothetical protein
VAGADATLSTMVRCHNCGAPRRADTISCPYCSATFTAANPPLGSTSIGPQAWDAEFVKMRRQPRTEGLLHERTGLPAAPRGSALRVLAPLVILGALAAYIVYSQRGADGSLDRSSLVIAGAFAAIGAAAAITGFRRAARRARTPIEGRLVRVGIRQFSRVEPKKGEERDPFSGHGKARWVVAFEDGTERFVWPVDGARGKDELIRGAGGVAWLQGPYVLGFEPL